MIALGANHFANFIAEPTLFVESVAAELGNPPLDLRFFLGLQFGGFFLDCAFGLFFGGQRSESLRTNPLVAIRELPIGGGRHALR